MASIKNDPKQDQAEGRAKGYSNLIPLSSRPPAEQFEIRSRGGRNAQKMNRERKTAQEAMQALLAVEVDPTRLREIYGDAVDMLPDSPTLIDALSLAQIREASQGSTRAFEAVRDTAGYQPTQKVNAEVYSMTDADRALLERVAKRMEVDAEE